MNDSFLGPSPLMAFWRFLKKNIKEEVGAAIAGLCLWKYGGQLWSWLLENIRAYPAQIVCVLLLSTAIFGIHGWLMWRTIAKLALEKGRTVDGLEAELASEKSKRAALQAQIEQERKPKDVLTPEYKLLMSCIFCAGEMTVSEMAAEARIDVRTVPTLIRDLQYHFQFVRRAGQRSSGDDVFEITELGERYAIAQGMFKIEQRVQQLRESAAEAEIAKLKKEVSFKDSTIEELNLQVMRLKDPQFASFHDRMIEATAPRITGDASGHQQAEP